jgi:hypothetical protein
MGYRLLPPRSNGCHEAMSSSLVRVNRLLKQRDALAALCGEIIATLHLPANRLHVEKVGGVFLEIIERWRRRFEAYSGEPDRPIKEPT